MDLSQCLGEVPVLGDWRKYAVSLRVHVQFDRKELVHYIDGRPLEKGVHPLRTYAHISHADVMSHLSSEIKALALISGWSPDVILDLLRVGLTVKG